MKEFNYKINGAPYRVVINNDSDGSVVELEVNGTPYKVELEKKEKSSISKIKKQTINTPTPQSASTPLVTRPKTSGGKNSIQSPLPGIILDIRCKVGDEVKKGQTLMILEAMKMENNILSNASGKIASILVQKGDSVLEGAELVVIE